MKKVLVLVCAFCGKGIGGHPVVWGDSRSHLKVFFVLLYQMVSKSLIEDAYLHLHGCVASPSIIWYSVMPALQTSEPVSLCLPFSFLSVLSG